MSLNAGDRIDRYEILGRLGAGGMGEVYRARDTKLERLVALKVLHVSGASETGGPARLLREARAAAALTHPNVLAIYDAGEVREPEALRGLPYIAMELVAGKTLRAYLGDSGIAMDKRIVWIRDIASALGAAHAAGLVHRDVKPENVMIRDDGTVKVLDFGIARRAAGRKDAASGTAHTLTATGSGVVVGTPFYMAPEQLRGEELDGRADQFAWGVLAYQLLTGKAPWTGEVGDTMAMVSQILTAAPRAPHEVDARVPVAASRTIVRALAKQRERRFASMSDLAASLASSTAEASTPLAPSETPTVRGGQRANSRHWTRRVARWALGAALLTTAVATTVATYKHRRAAVATKVAGTVMPTGAQCTSNRQCVEAHGGEAWHCHSTRHACTPLESVDCKVHAEPGDTEADDTVWFGGMFPMTSMPTLVGEFRAADLARQDFAQALSSSSWRSGSLHARRIGLLLCDEDIDSLRVARHLVEDVEAPAAFGFRSPDLAMKTIAGEFLPNHVLSFITISQTPALTRIPEPSGDTRLVWRSTLDRSDFAAPLVAFTEQVLEPAARARQGALRRGAPARPFRVAAVWAKMTSHDLIDQIFSTLHFNGRTALENGSDFRQFVYETDNGAPIAPDLIGDLLTFAPDVVFFGTANFIPKVLTPLEANWRQDPRPVYLTISGIGQRIGAFVGHDAEKRHRFFASNNVATSMPNAQLVLRYNLAFPDVPVVNAEAPQPTYDAFYMLAYAVHSLGEGEISGPAIARAFARLVPPASRSIDVGPRNILEGFEALRGAEGRIDLNGALGPLDFNPTTGEAPIPYAIDCLGVDDQGAATRSIDSGLVYDPKSGLLRGQMHCP